MAKFARLYKLKRVQFCVTEFLGREEYSDFNQPNVAAISPYRSAEGSSFGNTSITSENQLRSFA
jgi:hypothetical protein